MQLPQSTAHYSHRVRYGSYVARRLKRAGLEQLAVDVRKTTQAIKAAGRTWEDADEPLQDALADRDAADDSLDLAAQTARNALAGRSLDAVRAEPYTLIFPDGIGYYIAAPLDEETQRYTHFVERLERELPAQDAVRKDAVKAVHQGLKDFADASRSLDAARRAEDTAATALARATERWERQVEKTYGLLVAEVGRTRAEGFFPKGRAAKPKAAGNGGNGGEAGGAGGGEKK